MRQSNIELLRIVSMFMVLLVHADGAALGLPEPMGELARLTGRDIFRLLTESVTIIGVNSFTMISGYFGINLRWRGVVAYLFQCLFYSLLVYGAVCLLRPQYFAWDTLGKCAMVLTHTDLWYVPAYFFLMLLSPLLNAGLRTLSRRELLTAVGLFTAANIWCGWLWESRINPTGYTVAQLIMMYAIAGYIRRFVSLEWLRRRRIWILGAYLLSVAGIFAMGTCMKSTVAFAYNSPVVMLASVTFFSLFLTLRIESRAINCAARSAFAVYLIHKAPVLWGNYLRPFIRTLWVENPLWLFIIYVLALCAGIYLAAMLVDPLRRLLSRKLTGLLTCLRTVIIHNR